MLNLRRVPILLATAIAALVAHEGGVGGVGLRLARTRRSRPASFPSFMELFRRFDMDGTYTVTIDEWSSEFDAVLGYISLVHARHLGSLVGAVDARALAEKVVS